MATATFSTRIDFVDEDDADQLKTDEIAVEYTAFNRGQVDVPAGTTSTTAFTIPVGSLAAVTGGWIKNRTLQPLTLKINGSAALQNVAAGGLVLLADPDASATPITAITLTATTTETLAAKIAFCVFGDPV